MAAVGVMPPLLLALQQQRQEEHATGNDAASRFHKLKLLLPRLEFGWWQTPVQDGTLAALL